MVPVPLVCLDMSHLSTVSTFPGRARRGLICGRGIRRCIRVDIDLLPLLAFALLFANLPSVLVLEEPLELSLNTVYMLVAIVTRVGAATNSLVISRLSSASSVGFKAYTLRGG